MLLNAFRLIEGPRIGLFCRIHLHLRGISTAFEGRNGRANGKHSRRQGNVLSPFFSQKEFHANKFSRSTDVAQ